METLTVSLNIRVNIPVSISRLNLSRLGSDVSLMYATAIFALDAAISTTGLPAMSNNAVSGKDMYVSIRSLARSSTFFK